MGVSLGQESWGRILYVDGFTNGCGDTSAKARSSRTLSNARTQAITTQKNARERCYQSVRYSLWLFRPLAPTQPHPTHPTAETITALDENKKPRVAKPRSIRTLLYTRNQMTHEQQHLPAVVGAGVVLAVVDGHPDVPHAVPAVVLLETVLARALVALVALPGGTPRVLVAVVTLYQCFVQYRPMSKRDGV